MAKNIQITATQALSLLSTHKDKTVNKVHTMESAGPIVMGCDMTLTTIEAALKACKKGDICLSGPNMRRSGHGVAYWQKTGSWLFLETDKKKLDDFYKIKLV